MKPVEHWQTLFRQADYAVTKLIQSRKDLAWRYQHRLRVIRRHPRMVLNGHKYVAESVRQRNKAYFIRVARLARKEADLHKKIAYYQERISAIMKLDRFDRVRKLPPL